MKVTLNKDKVAENFFKKNADMFCVITLKYGEFENFISNAWMNINFHSWIIDNKYYSYHSLSYLFKKYKKIILNCKCLPDIKIVLHKESFNKYYENKQKYTLDGRDYNSTSEFIKDSSNKTYKNWIVFTEYLYTGHTRSGNERKDSWYINDFDNQAAATTLFNKLLKRDINYNDKVLNKGVAPYRVSYKIKRSIEYNGLILNATGNTSLLT